MKLFSERGLTVVPVLDDMGLYLGSHHGARSLASVGRDHQHPRDRKYRRAGDEPGRLQPSEAIARIVEGNDGKVLSVYSHSLPDTMRVEVTLKINREDISDILQSFERYEILR
jgi:acetoin utilization protein AcuB